MKFFSKAFFLVACLAVATVAQAQATRTWVSGVGDDANPCSRTAPCKTFAGAISKTAIGGEIDALDPGGFGAVTITKAITIDGGAPGNGGILAAGVNGIIVNASQNVSQVVIKNLVINGVNQGVSTDGIRFLNGLSLHLHNVVIQDVTGFCVNFKPATVGFLFISDSKFKQCGAGAVMVDGTTTFQRASIVRTVADASFFGYKAFSQALVDISDSEAAVAADTAFLADGANARMVAINSQANLSAIGVKANANAQVRFSGLIAHNTISTQNSAGGVVDSTGSIIVVFP